ncbi:MAG: hypothetical protein ACOYJI_04660 [Anaerovoracaceae bacterium]|jgi:hypothetical protein
MPEILQEDPVNEYRDKREKFLDRLLRNYEPYYTITRFDEEDGNIEETEGLPLRAQCVFDVHSEKYVLVKKAVLYEADSHEYLYIFVAPHFTKELYDQCHKAAYEKGMELVDPKPGHMYSYITAYYICDSCDPEVVKAVRKTRIRKNFLLSFRGWMEFHNALINVGEKTVVTNHAGKGNIKFLRKLLQH